MSGNENSSCRADAPTPRRAASAAPLVASARHRRALLAMAVLLGAVVRLSNWSEVFTREGALPTGDDDALYHVLRAERMVDGAEGAPWRDPNLNFPQGADILWPPL